MWCSTSICAGSDTTTGLSQDVSRIRRLLYWTWQYRSVHIRIVNISEHVCCCYVFVLTWMPNIPISQIEWPNFGARLVECFCISDEDIHTVVWPTDFVVTFREDEANNVMWKPHLTCMPANPVHRLVSVTKQNEGRLNERSGNSNLQYKSLLLRKKLF